MPVGHVVPEIVLVAGAAAGLVFALFSPRRWGWVGAVIALAALGGAMVVTAGMLTGDQMLTMGGTYAIDHVALWAKQIILASAAAVVLMSPQWLRTDARHGEYYTLLLLATLGAVLMAAAADTMELVVAVMLSSVGSYALAAFHRRSSRAAEAGMKMFLLGGLTNGFLLLGVVLLFGLAGSTLFSVTQSSLGGESGNSLALVAAAGLVTLGLTFKLGAVPAHSWVPDAAEASPLPAAAFLTVVPKLGALVALGRILSTLPESQVGWRAVAAAVAAATMTQGNLAALRQSSVRRLLGWSSVSQSGYGIMAVVALDRSELAVPAMLYFLVAYAIANLTAFGVVIELRGRTSIDDYKGLGRARPWLAAALVVALLSLVGIPALAGFFAKVALFGAVIEAGYGWLAGVALLNTVISLYYYLRVIAPMYLSETTQRIPLLGGGSGAAATIAAAATVALGVGAEMLWDNFDAALLLP